MEKIETKESPAITWRIKVGERVVSFSDQNHVLLLPGS